MTDSWQLAQYLRSIADFLESKQKFDMEYGLHVSPNICEDIPANANLSFYEKENFVKAARALGNSKKEYTDGDYGRLRLLFTESTFPFSIEIPRDKVCTKKVTYDCEPLFSEEEVAAL
jgi:hypothetical protein